MDNKYLKSINNMLDRMDSLSADKLLNLADEMLEFFNQLKDKIDAGDPSALAETLAMKQLIESKLTDLCETTGMSLEALGAFAANPQNLSPEDQMAAKQIAAKFQGLANNNQTTTKLFP